MECLWEWISETLVPGLYTGNLNHKGAEEYPLGATFDLVSRLLGVPLMRQVRIKNGMSF